MKTGYRADNAFDGEKVVPGGALVLVEEGRIVAVRPGSAAAPVGYAVTHLPGTTLLPGLVDTHAHLCCDSRPDALDRLPGLRPEEMSATIEAASAAQLRAGVTALRDLGDHHWAVVDRRDRLAGPTVVAAGPPITSVGGHCASMGGEAAGIDQLRRAVRDRAERGADLVKVMASGGAMTPASDLNACQFTPAELHAVVDEAHGHGLPVVAHAHALAAVEECLDAGVDGIEHCSCLTSRGRWAPPQLLERLAASGIAVGPTLGRAVEEEGPSHPTALPWDERLAHAGALVRAGVSLVSGGDSGISPVKPHGVLPHAVIDLVRCGLPGAAALASATGLAARACGLSGKTGRLRAGLDADLLLVRGDPVTDIAAIRDVRMVVSRGRVVVDDGRPR